MTNACTHTKTTNEYVGETNDWTGEVEYKWISKTISTTEDIDTGRYRCTQCNKVMYYTGLWREFWEKGTPCSGSERIKR